MKKCISLLLCLALALSCCAACAEAAPEAAEPAAHVLEKKEYPVYNGRMTLLYQALPLYFVDGVNDLPYVDLTDFVAFMNDMMNRPVYRGEYVAEYNSYMIYYEPADSSALFDFEQRTAFFSNYNTFATVPGKGQIDMLSLTADEPENGSPSLFKRTTNLVMERPGQSKTILLGDYDIPMFAQDGKLLLPLHTTFDLLMGKPGGNGIVCYFNGSEVFVGSHRMHSERKTDPETGKTLTMKTETGNKYFSAPKAQRSPELAQYGLCELCMELDTFYGLKDAHHLKSFFELMENTDFYKRLTDPDPAVADAALADFINFYMDDLHSAFIENSYMTGFETELVLNGYGFSRKADSANDARYSAAEQQMIPGGRDAYQEVGDTAFVSFNRFVMNDLDYYGLNLNDQSCIQDTVSLILYANRQITRENSPIKNVVLDLSLNGGGDADAAVYVIGWFLGEAVITSMDTFTDAQSTASYLVDTNLDGLFDDKDSLASKYNLYCLISPVSFSCGNLVPWVFKASGMVTLMGDTSGGGSCIVLPMSSAWGTSFQVSGNRKLAFVKNGSFYDVDRGVEPDVVLTKPATFYDREKLVSIIAQLY